jgi:hypothetical protein
MFFHPLEDPVIVSWTRSPSSSAPSSISSQVRGAATYGDGVPRSE